MKFDLPLHYQLRVYFSQLEKRTGVCSQVHDTPEQHILLWDFDEAKLSTLFLSLRKAQREYRLSEIKIIESSLEHYHAYCFTAQSFRETINILSSVPEIDMAYLRLGMVRGYYTLRITPKNNEKFRLVAELKSDISPNTTPEDVTVNEYLTSNKGGK